jgi:hypothetical protein
LKNHVTKPKLTPILVNFVHNNPVNDEILTVIGSGATSELQKQ